MTSVSAFSFINSTIQSNKIRTHNDLICKQTLNHLDLALNHYAIYTSGMAPA